MVEIPAIPGSKIRDLGHPSLVGERGEVRRGPPAQYLKYSLIDGESIMARIDYSFHGPARALHLDCRVKDFWEGKKKTYCYSEETKIPWRFDYTLKARVSVFPYPVSLHPSYAQYSIGRPETGEFQKIAFSIDNELLERVS
jgi:hypothetical protein